MRLAALPAVCVLALVVAGCDNSGGDSVTAPTSASATTSETFTGTLAPQGQNPHNFTVAVNGTITISLTAVGPPPTITVGIGLGVPSGTTCSLNLGSGTFGSTQASLSPLVSFTGVPPATYCVVIYDVGNLSNPVDYSITVAHS